MRGRCVAWIEKWEMKKGERGTGVGLPMMTRSARLPARPAPCPWFAVWRV